MVVLILDILYNMFNCFYILLFKLSIGISTKLLHEHVFSISHSSKGKSDKRGGKEYKQLLQISLIFTCIL